MLAGLHPGRENKTARDGEEQESECNVARPPIPAPRPSETCSHPPAAGDARWLCPPAKRGPRLVGRTRVPPAVSRPSRPWNFSTWDSVRTPVAPRSYGRAGTAGSATRIPPCPKTAIAFLPLPSVPTHLAAPGRWKQIPQFGGLSLCQIDAPRRTAPSPFRRSATEYTRPADCESTRAFGQLHGAALLPSGPGDSSVTDRPLLAAGSFDQCDTLPCESSVAEKTKNRVHGDLEIQRTPEEDSALKDASRDVRRLCCVDWLNPPPKAGIPVRLAPNDVGA